MNENGEEAPNDARPTRPAIVLPFRLPRLLTVARSGVTIRISGKLDAWLARLTRKDRS